MATIILSDDVYFTTAPTSDITTSQISNSQNYITVRVTPSLVESIFTNQPIVIPVPVPPRQQPSTNASVPLIPTETEVDATNTVFIVDIYRITTIFNVQGVLADLKGTGEDTALTKSNNLKILSKFGGVIRMVHRGTNDATQKVVTGIITKLAVREQMTGRETDLNSIASSDVTISYGVQIAFTRGQNK